MTYAAIQQDSFIELLPKKPFCADNYQFGTRIRVKAHAITYQHIQLNSPFKYNFISLDLDYPVSPDLCFIWENNNLPEPTYAVINPINNHAHLIFQLDSPVYANNEKQLSYYQDVTQILTDIYNADQDFAGTLTKNPKHNQWVTIESGTTYTLAELRAYAPKQPSNNIIRFNKFKRRTINNNNAYLGHRCELFEKSRIIAYNNVKEFSDQEGLFNYMIGVCSDQNPSDLKYSDILSTAKSISRYTWKHREWFSKGYTRNRVTSIEDLRNRQRKSATATAGTRHAKTLAIIEQAINNIVKQTVAMPALTKQYLAKLTGKSLSTIKRYAVEIDRFIRCAYQVLSPVLSPKKNSTPLASLAQLNAPFKAISPKVHTTTLTATPLSFSGDIPKPVLTLVKKTKSPMADCSFKEVLFSSDSTEATGDVGEVEQNNSELEEILEIIKQLRQISENDSNSS